MLPNLRCTKRGALARLDSDGARPLVVAHAGRLGPREESAPA